MILNNLFGGFSKAEFYAKTKKIKSCSIDNWIRPQNTWGGDLRIFAYYMMNELKGMRIYDEYSWQLFKATFENLMDLSALKTN